MEKLLQQFLFSTDLEEIKQLILGFPILTSDTVRSEIKDALLQSDASDNQLSEVLRWDLELLDAFRAKGFQRLFKTAFGSGSENQGPAIDADLVTNSQYGQFVQETGYPITVIKPQGFVLDEADAFTSVMASALAAGTRGFSLEKATAAPNDPVTEISWYDAREYARWAGKVLPSAEQWEEAVARGSVRLKPNIYEWTATAVDKEPFSPIRIKGPLQKKSSATAQDKRIFDNPPDDLWSQLGFRCRRDKDHSRKVIENAGGPATAFFLFPSGYPPHIDAVVDKIAKSLSQRQNQDLTVGHAKATILAGCTTADPAVTAIACLKVIFNRVLATIPEILRHPPDPKLLAATETLVEVGLSLSEETGDRQFRADCHYVKGRLLMAKNDVFGAESALKNCVEYYGLNTASSRQLALAKLAYGIASKNNNMKIGEELVSLKTAIPLLADAIQELGRLQLPFPEKIGYIALADALRLRADIAGAFGLCQLTIGSTTHDMPVLQQIEILISTGHTFLGLRRADYAQYCFSIAEGLASYIGSTTLIVDALTGRFMSRLTGERRSAIEAGNKLFQSLVYFEKESDDAFIGSVYNFSGDQHFAWTIVSHLHILLTYYRRSEIKLPVDPLVGGLLAFLYGHQDVVIENNHFLEHHALTDPTRVDGYYRLVLSAIANSSGDFPTAIQSMQDAIGLVGESSHYTLRIHAMLLVVNLYAMNGRWVEAIAYLNKIKPELIDAAHPEAFISYLEFEARILFWAGKVSAALDACDVATIQAFEKLKGSNRLKSFGRLHLLRGEIYQSVGFSSAEYETMNANMPFFMANDRHGLAIYYLRQADVSMDLWLNETWADDYIRKMISAAVDIIDGPTLGLEIETLQIELLIVQGVYLLRLNQFDRSRPLLEKAVTRASKINDPSLLKKSLTNLLELEFRLNGSSPEIDRLFGQLQTSAGKIKIIFNELLVSNLRFSTHILGQDLDKSYLAFPTFLSLYNEIRSSIIRNPPLRKEWLKRNIFSFDAMVGSVLIPLNKPLEAILLLESIKTVSLQDLIQESMLVSSNHLPTPQRDRSRALWKEIKAKQNQLERSDSSSDEMQEYATRVQLMELQKEWNHLWSEGLPAMEQFRFTEPDLETIFADPRIQNRYTLVEFYTTRASCFAFIIRSPQSIEVFDISGVNNQILEDLLQTKKITAPAGLTAVTPDLENLLISVHQLLFDAPNKEGLSLSALLKTDSDKHLIIIASGLLANLPIHASFSGSSGERRYFYEDFLSVAYIPSLFLLKRCLDQPARTDNQLLCINNPDHTLPNADFETVEISPLFADTQVLNHAEATCATVMDKIYGATIVHFACHGAFNSSSPLDTGILMADRKLNLADIYLGLQIRPGALIVLAACESGLVDPKFANEYQGLPIGFFSEAAGAVVSSLWRVNDCSTMLVMKQFYTALIDGASVAHALKTAQEYVRKVSAGELARMFKSKKTEYSSASTEIQSFIADAWREFQLTDPEILPFSHPYYWAGFMVQGF
jgi:CHAT domain-containing protein/tetratricopeptide (TPR) repeat protein